MFPGQMHMVNISRFWKYLRVNLLIIFPIINTEMMDEYFYTGDVECSRLKAFTNLQIKKMDLEF